jgi:16S rRNA (cytosine967-C5)-methyltransferase
MNRSRAPRPFAEARRRVARRALHGDVREAAAWVIDRTLAARAPADTFLESAKASCDERDHGLLHELVRGTLAWLRRLDHVVATASHRSFDRIEPGLHAPLRLGVYQLLFLDRVPAHAVVDEAVEQALRATHRGGASFVNAVLRQVARTPRLEAWPVQHGDPVEQLAIETSHPTFLVRRWLERFGPQRTRAILEANNRPRPLHLLAFRDRGGREAAGEELIDEQVEVVASSLAPLGLLVRAGRPRDTRAFSRGDFYVQDEASQAAALVPPPGPGERVLDLAAAPGGKSFSILAWEPTARCVACDRSLSRLLLLRDNARRLGRRLPALVMDGGKSACAPVFDRVVADLPCSGTGTLRRHPELKWRLRPSEIGRLAGDGLRMLLGGAESLRPGGLIAAITCSIEQEENEDVFARLLELRPELRPYPLEERVPLPWGRPVHGARWQVLPADEHDGFTVHVAERVDGPRRLRT